MPHSLNDIFFHPLALSQGSACPGMKSGSIHGHQAGAGHQPYISPTPETSRTRLLFEINLRSVTLLITVRGAFYTALSMAELGPGSQPAEPGCLDHLALRDGASIPHRLKGEQGAPTAPGRPPLC